MKTAIFAIAMILTTSASAWNTPQIRQQQTITTTPNVFGGHDYRSQGRNIGSSTPNVFGGYDYKSQGRTIGTSRRNVFGGQTLRITK